MQDSVKSAMSNQGEVHALSEPVYSSTFTPDPVASGTPRPSVFTPRTVVGVVATVALGSLALIGGLRIAKATGQVNDAAHILPGVRVAGIAVGGMTRDEALARVRDWSRKQVAQKVTFLAPVSGREWNLTLADAGGRFDSEEAVKKALAVGRQDNLWDHLVKGGKDREDDIEVPFRFNESQLDKQLLRIGKAVYKAPKNARASIDATGDIKVAQFEIKGVKLDVPATRKALLKDGTDSLRDGGQTNLVVAEETPRVTAADIEAMNYKLGAFATDYSSSSSNRRHNVEKATTIISGTLLAPGELFSYNEVVGPREPELGWRLAPTIQDGQMVPGPGGGVCQVSTTLFNAVRRAKMEIVARQGHSKPVHYAPPGMDATVAYGSIDFKFRNSLDKPVLIVGQAVGGRLQFSVFGAEPGSATARKVAAAPKKSETTVETEKPAEPTASTAPAVSTRRTPSTTRRRETASRRVTTTPALATTRPVTTSAPAAGSAAGTDL